MGKKHKSKKKKGKHVLPEEDLKYLIENTKHSQQEICEWYKSFLKECPNGVLSKAELHAMYSKMLPNEDPTILIDQLFRIFDQDQNGTIEFKEFVIATDITTSADPEEKLRWTFKLYDKDSSGSIEMSELVEILHTVYVMEGIQSAMVMATTHARQIFSDLDEDKNGSITLEEFVEGCMHDSELLQLIGKDDDETSCQDSSLPKEQQNAP